MKSEAPRIPAARHPHHDALEHLCPDPLAFDHLVVNPDRVPRPHALVLVGLRNIRQKMANIH